jgi:hypothetical protein
VTDSRIFCLDTSALINPWNHYYAPDLTPGYWRDVPQMVRDGRAVLSEEVREELERIDDGLRQWARTNILAWHPLTDPIQEVVRDIMANWGKLVDVRKDRSRADPFVIATAKVTGATVVTGEKHGGEKDPRIPFVCARLDVPCLDVFSFVREARINLF